MSALSVGFFDSNPLYSRVSRSDYDSSRAPGESLQSAWYSYLRDDMRSSMMADKVGGYIVKASSQQVAAIGEATRILSGGLNTIANLQVETNRLLASVNRELQDVNNQLSLLNRRMDILIEQQRLTNIKLDSIAELLKIPESEKERQRAITMGIKFFVNAAKDEDLYKDALDNFLKAEQMFPQDYFVLHRIGCIYLYVPLFLDVEKASQYFEKAAKYAAVESDPDAVRIANLLTNNINTDYTNQTSDINSIGLLAADSYSKAALAYYIMGDDDMAVDRQSKAVKYAPSGTNKFTFAKYLSRKGNVHDAMKMLTEASEIDSNIVDAIPFDLDLIDKPETLAWLNYKQQETDNILDEAFHSIKDGLFKNVLNFRGRFFGSLSMKLALTKW